MNRFVVTTCMLLLRVASTCVAGDPTDRPNILFLFADDQADVDRYPLRDIAVPKDFLPLYPHKDKVGLGEKLRDEAPGHLSANRTQHPDPLHGGGSGRGGGSAAARIRTTVFTAFT